MLLAVDIGNSALKFAFFEGDKLVTFFNHKFKKFNSSVLKEYKPSEAVITSVVPDRTKVISKTLVDLFNISPYIISHKSSLNLKIDYEKPSTLGVDRICSTEGAFNENLKSGNPYNEKSIILVVDFGTATTLNFIKYNKVFNGGMILPGFKTMVKALNLNTAQLPQIKSTDYKSLIGKNTRSAIASGIINATVGLIDKSVNQLRAEGEYEISVYTTGGNYYFFSSELHIPHIHIEDLVLRGAKIIYERNKVVVH